VTDPPDHRDHRDDFAAFFEKEYKSVVAALMRAGATFEDAEDAVVETMTIAARRFDRLTTPGAWVRVVAMRRFIRKRQRDRERELREQLAAALSAPPQPEDPDLVRLVRSILDDLPPTQCIVMALHMEGYSCPEIASMLGSSQDTIRSNLRYARRAMAIGLKKGGWNFS
jgi:RNA polymerase sigma-70 factor (ECF subfamily)